MTFPWAAALLAVAATTSPACAASYDGIAKGPTVAWVTQNKTPVMAESAIRQTAKAFVPSLVVVTVGSTVRFPNDDNFFHSVYSESKAGPFDLGLYDTGPGKSITVASAGLIDVRCHVHGTMHATIIVVDGPFAQTSGQNEQFHIDGLTLGRKTLHLWTGGADVAEIPIVVK